MVGRPRARRGTPLSRGSGEWKPDLLPLHLVRIARPLSPLPANGCRPMSEAFVFSRCAAALCDEWPRRTRLVCRRPQDGLQGPLLATEGSSAAVSNSRNRVFFGGCSAGAQHVRPRRRGGSVAGRRNSRRPPGCAPVLHRKGGGRRACGLHRGRPGTLREFVFPTSLGFDDLLFNPFVNDEAPTARSKWVVLDTPVRC